MTSREQGLADGAAELRRRLAEVEEALGVALVAFTFNQHGLARMLVVSARRKARGER